MIVKTRRAEETSPAGLAAGDVGDDLYQPVRRLLASADRAAALETTLDAAIALSGADFAAVHLLDSQAPVLRLAAQRGFDAQFIDYFGVVKLDDAAPSARAFRERRTVDVVDVAADADHLSACRVALAAGYRALRCAPLVASDGRALGVLAVHFRRELPRSGALRRRLERYASAAADMLRRFAAEAALAEACDTQALKLREHGLLLREHDHRMRNIFASIQAVIKLADGGEGRGDSAFRATLRSRILAMMRAHDLLRRGREGVSVQDVFRTELEVFDHRDQVRFEGTADVPLEGDHVIAFALVAHELTTNAAKHGALSKGRGALRVRFADGDGGLLVDWRESGGPPVKPPQRRGFGSLLIKQALGSRADVQTDYEPDGLRCRIVLAPEARTAPAHAHPRPAEAG